QGSSANRSLSQVNSTPAKRVALGTSASVVAIYWRSWLVASLNNVVHPDRRLLKLYKHRGVPLKFGTEPWASAQVQDAIHQGPHKSCLEYIDFLEEEFVNGLSFQPLSCLIPVTPTGLPPTPSVVPQCERRPRWICDYTWSNVNRETLPLVATKSMQIGRHCLLLPPSPCNLDMPLNGSCGKFCLPTPITVRFTSIKLISVIVSIEHRVGLNDGDIPNLGVIFPTRPGDPPLVALPLVTPMGWKNSPPRFSTATATETIADMTNT
ncbi:hypothetical protein ACHAXR_004574, partial [Thalassiosira sp. AJA248-18]